MIDDKQKFAFYSPLINKVEHLIPLGCDVLAKRLRQLLPVSIDRSNHCFLESVVDRRDLTQYGWSL